MSSSLLNRLKLLDLDKREPHSEAKSAALVQALGGHVSPRLLAHLIRLLDLECTPWSKRENPLPVPLPKPYEVRSSYTT